MKMISVQLLPIKNDFVKTNITSQPEGADVDTDGYGVYRRLENGEVVHHNDFVFEKDAVTETMRLCKAYQVPLEPYPWQLPLLEDQTKIPQILKGIGKKDGDGWKDVTKVGEVVYVWNKEKPEPYAKGQYPRIGNEGWSAGVDQFDFFPASIEELIELFGENSPLRR